MSAPVIAIVGRPNVGKSTFFNRVLRQRKAIVDSQEGITRDRVYGETEWSGKRMSFIDTGGFIPEDLDIFNAAVREHSRSGYGSINGGRTGKYDVQRSSLGSSCTGKRKTAYTDR